MHFGGRMKRLTRFVSNRSVAGYVVVAALVGSFGVAGWALAAGGSGTLHGCAKKSNGALRLAGHCRKSERAVSWSIRGPQGTPGARGTNGTNGSNGSNGAPGVQYVWSAWLQPAGTARSPQTDGHVTKFTFTSPAAGFVSATVHFGVRVHNTAGTDCHVESQLASAPSTTLTPGPGYMDSWINGNLPTENGVGTYLQLDASVDRVFPVVAGPNTIYLNGDSPNCADALWGPVSVSAVFANQNPTATLTAP
ncbi:MAG: hypothetical protein QOJ25_1573 [Solirubrobacteraceae bacterium]|nr:hypothetical protein [Solirubrobacteraceae bacterium]